MNLIPGISFWSFRRVYRRWEDTIDDFLGKTLEFKEKFALRQLAVEFGASGSASQLKKGSTIYHEDTLNRVAALLDDNSIIGIPHVGNLIISPDSQLVERNLASLSVALQALPSQFQLVSISLTFDHRITQESRVSNAIRILATLGHLTGLCKRTVAFENRPEGELAPSEIREIIRSVPNLAFTNDVGNWLYSRRDPLLASKQLVPVTRIIHWKDLALNDGVWYHVTSGKGLVPSEEIIHEYSMVRDSRSVPCLIELDNHDGVDDSALIELCLRNLITLLAGGVTHG